MTEKNKIETRLEALGSELRGQESVVGDVMDRINRISAAAQPLRERRDAVMWRFIMNRYTKIAAAAAVLIIAAIVTFMAMEKATPMAYALEQTVAAIQNVRFVHLRFWQADKDEPIEAWMEYDEKSEPLKIRLSLPTWKSPEDGPKEILWQDNVAQVLMVRKKALLTITDKKMAGEFRQIASQLDAGTLFKQMVAADKSGQRKVDVTMPSGEGESIIVTSTATGNNGTEVLTFHLDPATRLATLIEITTNDAAGKKTTVFKMECDYTRPDTDVFAIVVPAGTMNIDMVNTVVGVPQGEMTDEQAAKETVRQFWQALIDKDYQKAGGIFSGVPADKIQEMFRGFKFIRVVSMDEPSTDAVTARMGGLRVKSVVEVEVDGRTAPQSFTFSPIARKGDDQAHPNNWMISGGI
jgi:hypothetical protein